MRTSNLVTGGFSWGTGAVTIDYAPGEVQGQSSWGTRTGVMVDVNVGPVKIAGALSAQKDPTGGSADVDTTNIGAA